jgi:histidinol dehydrogenase
MKTTQLQKASSWEEVCKRPSLPINELNEKVNQIIEEVKLNKDRSLISYAKLFDKADLKSIAVTKEEIELAILKVPTQLMNAIDLARKNITSFHESQRYEEKIIETAPGVFCWRKSVGIESVGLYIPGGTAPLFSTVLMLGIPAILAECKNIILCTPPNKNGEINPVILYTANLLGIKNIYKVGGAQAIAAMAYGTETIKPVSKIFGPGNQYVTKAKEIVLKDGLAIDMPAGPSEVLVIADSSCVPSFVAADLLSQAEHGYDSQVVLLTNDSTIVDKVNNEIKLQLESAPRRDVILKSLMNSKSYVCESIEDCFLISNKYAPEHLIIASKTPDNYLSLIVNAGSVFVGNLSCESAGDYASGTNHTLPTNGYAKNYSGVSLDSFVRKITFQKLNQTGIESIGPAIEVMAEAEQLFAHKNAVSIRLKSFENV